MTSLHKLASLPEVASFLRPDVTLLGLQQLARELTDVQAAEKLREAPPGAVQAGNHTHRRSPWTTRHFDHRSALPTAPAFAPMPTAFNHG